MNIIIVACVHLLPLALRKMRTMTEGKTAKNYQSIKDERLLTEINLKLQIQNSSLILRGYVCKMTCSWYR